MATDTDLLPPTTLPPSRRITTTPVVVTPEPTKAARDTARWRGAPGRRPPRRFRRVMIGSFLLVVAVSAFLWVASWFQPPRPVQLVLVGAGYQQNLAVPHNIFGWNSLQDLAEAVSGNDAPQYWGRRLWHRPPQVFTLHREFDWASLLAPQEPPAIVLYVAAHGAADASGAYLLADDADMADTPQNRWRLLPLIEQLAKLPAEKNKVLVLDAAQLTYHAPLGILQNDFAEELQKYEAQVRAVPNLVVICASNRDQRSWPITSYGRTAFGHFWIEGIRGAAHDENNDGRLNLTELFDFASLQVSDWIRRHEDNAQTPFLLPSGEEGRERAEKIVVAWKNGGYVPSTPRMQPPSTVPKELTASWQQAYQLATRSPHPYMHQPQTWRRYVASLRRYEELLLAGNREDAAHLLEKVQRLADQCTQDPLVALNSLDSCRALHDPALALVATKMLDALASAPPTKMPETWQKQGAQHATDLKALRSEIYRQLLTRAQADPAAQLATSATVAHTIHDPLQPLPPAIHLLVMLNRDLPASARTPQRWPQVARILQTRQLAEDATAGESAGFTLASPLVRPWVAEVIAQADWERQQAEDLLLVDNSDATQVDAHLLQATKMYQQALEDGRQVLTAYQVRDAALAMLPEVCDAIGRAATCSDPNTLVSATQLQSLTELWGEVHALSRQLSMPTPCALRACPLGIGTPLGYIGPIERASRVAKGLEAVRDGVDALWQKLAAQDHVSNELGLVEFPAPTWLNVELREQGTQQRLTSLLRRREDMTQLLLLSAGDHFVRREAQAPTYDQQQERKAQVLAHLRGKLALAVLGEVVFDELANEHDDRWPQAQYRLQVFNVEENWRASIRTLATQIAARWCKLPEEVDTILDAAMVEVEQHTMGRCVHADAWSRLVPIAFAHDLDDNASRHLQALRLGAFLLWQAERDWQDHWFALDPHDPPYYQTLGQSLIADAEQLAPRLVQLNTTRAQFAQPDNWTLQSQTRAALTPEQPLRLSFKLTRQEQSFLPKGIGAVRWQTPVTIACAGQTSENAVALWPEGKQPAPLQAAFEVSPTTSPELADGDQQSLVIDASIYHRGRTVNCRVPVDVFMQPEVLVNIPTRPSTAQFITVASPELQQRFGQGSGAVTIVLDCSGSMGTKPGEAWSPKTRYAQATHALDSVLTQLPPGTELSLWLFGEAMGNQKTVPQAEQTIRCVRKLSPWQPTDAPALLKQVSYPVVEPWNESAVVEAILTAKQDLQTRTGFKSLIVLTDGIDNRFEQDKQVNPRGLDVATALSESFRGSGIMLNIVGFQIASHEDEEAHQQFSVIESFSPPGRFYRVDQAADLLAAMTAALDQRLRYWVQDFDRRYLPGVPADGLSVEALEAALASPPLTVSPGERLLRTWAGAPLDKDVILQGGDWLIANLNDDGENVTIERAAILPRFYRDALRQSAGNWHAAVLSCEPTPQKGLALQVALERQPDAREAQLAASAPREIWWEMAWPNGTPLPAIACQRLYNTPTAQWQLEVHPSVVALADAGDALQISAWWLSENETPAAVTLVAGQDFAKLSDLADRVWQIDGDQVAIEGVRVERRDVNTSPGHREQQPCVIVSLQGSPGKSYWVRWRNTTATGIEQHHYASIGRNVGIAWPLDEQTAIAPGTRLEIVPLDALKREAQARGLQVTFKHVPLPVTVPAASPAPSAAP